MKTIQTCLWFNTQGEEAAKLYTSTFPNSEIQGTVPYGKAASRAAGQPVGKTMTVEFQLAGLPFLALNGGPHFKPDPSISFFVSCDSEAELDKIWSKLKNTVRMDAQEYPFAKKYGWCEDKFGINWQLFLSKEGRTHSMQKIAPALLFANEKYGKAKEAIDFYISQFPNSKVGMIARDEKTNAVLHSRITLAGLDFILMEGPLEPQFDFSPAISFMFGCDSQKELDEMWSKLSAVPDAEACGWLCDKYGVSWQAVHKDWGTMLYKASPEGRERLMGAITGMKKPDLNILERASRG